jgi:cold shock CspA family protein
VFVHILGVERAGLSPLDEGQPIEYEEVSSGGKDFSGKSQGLTPRVGQ